MLIVLRIVLAAGIPLDLTFDVTVPNVGISGVDCVGCRVGNAEGLEGALRREGVAGRLFRGGLDEGIGGSALVGGSAAGRDKTGRDITADQM